MDLVGRGHPVHVVTDHALVLRDTDHSRLAPRPLEHARIVRLATALRVEGGLIQDDEVGAAVDDFGVELAKVAGIRILTSALLHVEYARRHSAPRTGRTG